MSQVGDMTRQTSSKTLSSSERSFQSHVALITGATRGIGLAIARSLATKGCNLIVTGRDHSALDRISRELSRLEIQVLAQPCDIRDPDSVDDLFRSLRRQFKHLDILINNAGIAHANLPVERLPFPVWKSVIEISLRGEDPPNLIRDPAKNRLVHVDVIEKLVKTGELKNHVPTIVYVKSGVVE